MRPRLIVVVTPFGQNSTKVIFRERAEEVEIETLGGWIPGERKGVENNGHNFREQTQERAFPDQRRRADDGRRETAGSDGLESKLRNQRRI